MRLSNVLRRLAVVAGASALIAGVPVAPPAFADEPITNVTPDNGVNDDDLSVQFDVGASYLLVPAPTVTFVRTADATDTIEVATGDVSFSGSHFTVTVDLTGANPGMWDIEVSGTEAGPPPATVVSSCTSCFEVFSPAPDVTSVAPVTARITETASFQINGSHFAHTVYCVTGDCTGKPTVTVEGGSDQFTLASSATATSSQITISITPKAAATPGYHDVTVTNTDGKSDICDNCLLVTPKVASVTYVANPATTQYGRGAKNRHLTVTGNGFANGATVAFTPSAGITINSTTFVSATELDLDLTLTQEGANAPATGNHTVVVTNPVSAGSGVSNNTVNLSVQVGPTLTSVTPASRGRGATSQSITLTGTNFSTAGVTVTIPDVTLAPNGSVTSTSIPLTATISPTATAGPRDVTVLNDNNKGQYVCTGCFTIDNLQVDSLSDTSIFNDADHTLTVTGFGFDPGATVKLQKTGTGAGTISDIEGTLVSVNPSGTAITATFATTGVAPGTWKPRVTNPEPNGTGACTCTLTIAASTPTISSVAPDNRGAGADNETIEINGTGFAPGAVVSFSNSGVHVVGTPTITPTKVTVVVDIDGDAEDPVGPPPPAPQPSVSVTNTDAKVASADFTVNAPPIATSLDKTARAQGTATLITYTGDDLTPGATVLFSGTGITTDAWVLTDGNGVVTHDTLKATVTVASDAPLGVRTATIRNGDGGRATCETCTLTINPQPTVTSVAPAKAAIGQTTPVVVNGTGFLSGVTVSAEAGITATVGTVTATTINVSLNVAAGQPIGNRIVTVFNPDGGSASKADALKLFTVPGAPTGVSATRGQGAATVSWAAPASDGNDPILSYTITSNPGNVTKTVDAPATNGTVTGLNNGQSYTFTVKATNAAGDSPASSASNAVTPATVPDAPTGISASADNAQATVSWTAPAFNGGSAITQYTVTSTPGGITKTVDAPATNATVTGLTNGTSYTFKVFAINDVGNGAESVASNTVVPATVPDAPTDVSAAASDASALVSWVAAFNGGSPLTGYTVTSSPGGVTANAAGTATSVNVTGLTNGTAYTFTVVAKNAKGDSVASSPSPEVTPFTIPGAPTGVTATALARSADVSWTAPTSNGGNTISGYTVTSSPEGHTATVNGTTLTARVTGLTAGQAYTFSVVATNTAGNSAPSASSSAVTPYDIPSAPTGVSATRGDHSATVSWTLPTSNGGSALTGFTVTSSPGGITKEVSDGTATSTSVTGLTNGQAYTFTVVAHNAGGDSAASSASNSVTPAGLPAAPPSVTATAGHAAATISWTAPSGNGAPVTGYTVTRSPGGVSKTVTTTSTTFTGLTNGTLYTFAVKATNAVGTGAATTSNGVRPTWVTKLSVGASTFIVSGGTSTVSGKLTRSDGVGIVGASVRIYRRIAPSTTYTLVRTVTSGTGGAYKTSFAQTRNTYYQARFAGATGYAAVNGPARLTYARYKLSVAYSRVGRTLTAKGSISPSAAGRTVYLQHRRADGSIVNLRSATVAGNGTYTLTRALPPGTYNVRVYIASSSTNYLNYTAITTFRIT